MSHVRFNREEQYNNAFLKSCCLHNITSFGCYWMSGSSATLTFFHELCAHKTTAFGWYQICCYDSNCACIRTFALVSVSSIYKCHFNYVGSQRFERSL